MLQASLTPQQCRMSRAALGLGVRDLAAIADVSPNTIARLERGESMHPRTHHHLRGALEAQGLLILTDGERSLAGGPGVRLGQRRHPTPRVKLFLSLWEHAERLPIEPSASQDQTAYDWLIDIFRQYLDIVAGEGREPDAWEQDTLNEGLNALNRSSLLVAFACIRNAITPPDNRSPNSPLSGKATTKAADRDLSYFRKCLSELGARGPKKRW